MGTRADFYIGRGENSQWLGSIGWDGYPSGISDDVLGAKTEEEFKAGLASFFSTRGDVTLPDQGWPWPWDDSGTTDYAYAFDDGSVHASNFGHGWFPASEGDMHSDGDGSVDFPNMSEGRNTAFDDRSGAIFITA